MINIGGTKVLLALSARRHESFKVYAVVVNGRDGDD